MKAVKQRALEAAMRAIPMVGDGEAYRKRLADFQRGYMAGHASMTRHASKLIREIRSNDIHDGITTKEKS